MRPVDRTSFRGTKLPQPPAKTKHKTLAMPPSIDAALYANVGRYSGAVVLTVFEQIGGADRMAEWADENPGEFYGKLFTKVISSPKSVEVTGKVTIEEAVKMLDLQEGSDYTVVEDAEVEEEPDNE